MKTQTRQLAKSVAAWSSTQLIGLATVLLSLLLFLLPEMGIRNNNISLFGNFFFNYVLAFSYLLLLLVRGQLKFRAAHFNPDFLLIYLVLALISCFSLNREITIFNISTFWLDLYLITIGVAMLGYTFRQKLPAAIQRALLFCLGAGFLLVLYYAIYLIPLYLIGLIGTLFLGIGLHVLVPLQAVLCLILIVKKAWHQDKRYFYSFATGIALPLVLLANFLGQWHERKAQIQQIQSDYIIADNTDLPQWVHLAQQLAPDRITEKLLKTKLVYQIPNPGFTVWDLPSNNFEETKCHDPLVMIAALLFGAPELQENERIKILEAMYDARHQAQERLWSGQNLQTSSVVSQVRVYPQFRFSYTEKVLRIKNSSSGNRSQEEAIYTFYLPEGSVVTSLSLWVNGVEEKAALTTQSKADTAYKTIVGREARDPSVVHWQEGNTVSVRIFPCTPDENRQFKIGISSPLREDEGQLVYDAIYFSGPPASSAPETSLIYLEQPVTNLELPSGYNETKPQHYRYQGNYRHDWQVRFAKPAFSAAPFHYQGYSYHLAEATTTAEQLLPQRVYLDLNQAWTKNDFETVWQAVKQKKVYVYDGELVKLTEENRWQQFEFSQKLNFTLFPLHLIKDPAQALLISKSNGVSPNLKDLKGSQFSQKLSEQLPAGATMPLFQIGPHLSPYLKTLKELQIIAVNTGSVTQLQEQLQEQKFYVPRLSGEAVAMGASGLQLVKTKKADTSTAAPDHLLRLFSYNHLLQQIGSCYFSQSFIEEQHLAEAQLANIVSPVSSLIVLETQQDYDRFRIEKSRDTLGNATMKSAGAVPEPEEWALIIVAVLLAAILTLKPYFYR